MNQPWSRLPQGLGAASVLVALALGLSPARADQASDPSRDEELFGSVYHQPLSRLSVFGGMGYGSVRGGGLDFTPSGRLALDLGLLWDLGRSARLGVAFDHLRFEETSRSSGNVFPREVSDVAAFLRLDGRDGRLTPYLTLGGGFYFADNSTQGDVFRVGGGIEIPLARTMLRLEGRYANYGDGAFSGQTDRQTTLTLLLGMRFLLVRDDGSAGGDDIAERLRGTLRYIAEPDEVAELDALETDAEVLAFFDAFWRRRDPYPEVPGNAEREVFLERVAIATSRFGELGKPGWATERGRVIIIYGQPDEVIWEASVPHFSGGPTYGDAVASNVGTSSALELWIYYRSLPRATGQQAFFLYEEDAVSRYNLIWTNVSGEIGFGRALPALPPTIAAPISAVGGVR